jgi:predicted nuclease with TOPRIM domain
MELTNEHDQSIHVKPYADMIENMSYVQKADFAKAALDTERDRNTYKQMYQDTVKERDGWMSEYRAARSEVERLKQQLKEVKEKLSEYENQWEPSKQEQIDSFSEKFDQLDEEYQDLVRIATCLYKADKEAIKEMINEGLGGDNFDKFKDHIGV